MSFGEDFSFDVLKDELIIGEIYVRVYNEQPTYVLEDPKGFVTALLDFIGSNAQVGDIYKPHPFNYNYFLLYSIFIHSWH